MGAPFVQVTLRTSDADRARDVGDVDRASATFLAAATDVERAKSSYREVTGWELAVCDDPQGAAFGLREEPVRAAQ